MGKLTKLQRTNARSEFTCEARFGPEVEKQPTHRTVRPGRLPYLPAPDTCSAHFVKNNHSAAITKQRREYGAPTDDVVKNELQSLVGVVE